MVFFAISILLASLLAGTLSAAVPATVDPEQLLRRADTIKTSNHAEFAELLKQLDGETIKLSAEQQWYLRFLDAWEAAYSGDYKTATTSLNAIMDQSPSTTLRFRAGATLVNMLGIGHRYEEAFARLSQLLDQLPEVDDKEARFQGLGEAAQLYIEAGQYDLALNYANQLLAENSTGEYACKGRYLVLDARYRSGKLQDIARQFQEGIDVCVDVGGTLFANGIRADMARFEIQQGRAAAAINLLQRNYAEVLGAKYQSLISQFDALLAMAYWKDGQVALAEQFAHDAINSSIRDEYTESLTTAYELLYRIKLQQRAFAAALSWHEKYMAADKAYLNDVGTKALAYQVVKQQVQAKKLEVETLGKQNQILQLQQALDRKASETSRLYIALLLSVLVFIALWAYRIKLSQLRFMRLARRDGLTDIFNRQHFLNEAELQLQYCRRASRDACLVLIDLDHFKAINDTHGHAVGDRVLQRAVGACKAHLRSTDVFGRLGGEEFGILLPECSLEQVLARADQLRAAVASAASDGDDLGIQISASFGVACSIRSGYELHLLLVHADEALYRAKREGRNRVRVSDDGAEACHGAEVVSIERV
ncbi:GGDEF domain-containing protein [Rhodanobacter glycinis]|uniref:GGDEF domain-containing protein n=1 Tax=Rhodanobacter glycinis TaxID=582702 RepID=UPI0031B85267